MLAMGNFNRGRSGGGSFERRGFRDRDSRGPAQMHQAVCDNCKRDCEVPFRPTSGKPIFCSNCFESRREDGGRSRDRFQSRPQTNQFTGGITKEQFEQLNSKLDKILIMLTPKAPKKKPSEETSMLQTQ